MLRDTVYQTHVVYLTDTIYHTTVIREQTAVASARSPAVFISLGLEGLFLSRTGFCLAGQPAAGIFLPGDFPLHWLSGSGSAKGSNCPAQSKLAIRNPDYWRGFLDPFACKQPSFVQSGSRLLHRNTLEPVLVNGKNVGDSMSIRFAPRAFK